MAITPLVLPSTSSAESPSLVTVHPAAIATILDQHIRRPKDQDGNEQDRVLGTLMGSRNEVSSLGSFALCCSFAFEHAAAAAAVAARFRAASMQRMQANRRMSG